MTGDMAFIAQGLETDMGNRVEQNRWLLLEKNPLILMQEHLLQ